MTLPAVVTPMSTGITQEFLHKVAPELARDIVLKIGGAKELATQFYSLTEEQWNALKAWPQFQKLVETAQEEFAGPLGMAEQIRRQARYALAMGGITDVVRVTSNPKSLPQHVLKGVEVLAEIGGINVKSAAQAGAVMSSGPLVQIIMPNGNELSVGLPPIEHKPE